MEALNAASGFLQRELHARLSMKSVPRLSFVSDDSLERGLRMLERIDEVRSQDTPEETP